MGCCPFFEKDIRKILSDINDKHFGLTNNEYSIKILCLAHKISTEKIKLVPDKIDTMIIQSVSLLGDLDKDINLHCMRLREWYGFHFPELSSIVENNKEYLNLITIIKKKEEISEEKKISLREIIGNKTERILRLASTSMGTEMTDHDIQNILDDTKSILKSFKFRDELAEYVKRKMEIIAPNLTVLVGEITGAKMISKAGSLSNLAKMPGSTIQILGAEKALYHHVQ